MFYFIEYSDRHSMSASTETSEIADFYKNKSVFITGATGFIGKQLVEKLVRSCPGENHTYSLYH